MSLTDRMEAMDEELGVCNSWMSSSQLKLSSVGKNSVKGTSAQSGQFEVSEEVYKPRPVSPLLLSEEELENPFTDEEIRAQLEALGYCNIPDYQLRLFKEDLEKLIWHEQDKKRHNPKEGDDDAVKTDEDEEKLSPEQPFKSVKTTIGNHSAREPKLHHRQVEDEFGWPKGRSPSASSDSSRSGHNPRWHRRKVLRHFRGEPVICEEPTDTDSDISVLSDRISSLPMDDSGSEKRRTPRGRQLTWARDCPVVNAVLCKKSQSQRSSASSSSVKQRMQRGVYYDEIIRYLPKTFVENDTLPPIKKTNPQQRFDMYKRMWNTCRIPGETPDHELRWCIRALLLTRRVPEVEMYGIQRKDAIERARSRRQNRS